MVPECDFGTRAYRKAGIHGLLLCDDGKSWIPAFAGMTIGACFAGMTGRGRIVRDLTRLFGIGAKLDHNRGI